MRKTGWAALGIGGAVAIAAVGGYWFATGGIEKDRRAPAWLTQRPIAHRGLHSGDSRVPENSLVAFRAAADAGYAIELDVQMTSDGQLVVSHDDDLARMTGLHKKISATPASEVLAMRLLESTQTVPSLRAVFHEVGGRVPILVEIKNEGTVGRLEEEVAKAARAERGSVAVISFNPFSLARVGALAPDVPRGQVSSTFHGDKLAFAKKVVLGAMLMNWKSRPDFIAYELEGLPSLGTWLQRRRGRPLVVWTAETAAEYDRAKDLGDAVEFELAARPR